MKDGTHGTKLPITKIVAKGACPICAALKEFQNVLLENLQGDEQVRLCNPHAWGVANSAPAGAAVSIFLEALRDPGWKPAEPGSPECEFCKRVHQEKVSRMEEIVRDLEQPKLRDWLHDRGTLCSRHARELSDRVPSDLRKMIQETRLRTVGELEEELREFLQQARKGMHAGGGILGHVAEFLVAQRGIVDWEARCSQPDQQKKSAST